MENYIPPLLSWYSSLSTQFKDAIEQILSENKIRETVNVYPRKLWTSHRSIRTTTRALVVGVSSNEREAVTEILIKTTAKGYENVEFIPLAKINDEFYTQTMRNIFLAQNKFLHNLDRKSMFGITNATTEYKTKDGLGYSTLAKWLEAIQYENNDIVESCEVGQKDSVHIIYQKKMNT